LGAPREHDSPDRAAATPLIWMLDLTVFKSVSDSLSAAALTWIFSVSAFRLIQDHPVHIP